jgi:putative PIN family toxin of toxin-antitoxin system
MLFLQAVTNEGGPAFACFELVDQGRLELYLSPEILAEVRDVLGRPRIRRKFPDLTQDRIDEFMAGAEAKAVVLGNVPQVFHYTRDPDDEPYINLAIAADAQYLVSRDNDLLDLMADPAFRSQYPGLSVLDPAALLRQLGPPGPVGP